MMKKAKIDYLYYVNFWKDYFISKGFQVYYEDVIHETDYFVSLRGCKPQIRIEIYAGNYRTDTKTHGCICADFNETYNKVSQCPVYCDLDETETSVWKAIEMLMNAGKDFSNSCGRIIKSRGNWDYSPPIFNKKDKTMVNN